MTAIMSKVRGIFKIIRPENSFMVGISILVGATITGGIMIIEHPIELIFAFVTGFTLSGAAMSINDFFDRKIDAINEPQRPIPSGLITSDEALYITFGLSLLGLIASWMINFQAFLIALIAWILLMVYSSWGKKTGFLGNLMVSSCISLPFLYGGVLTGYNHFELIFSLLAFLTNTGREITKGIVDFEGDKEAKIMTIAVTHGPSQAAIVASLFYSSAVILSVIPIYLDLVSIWYLPFVLLTDLGLIGGTYTLLKNPSRENSRNVKKNILYFMLSGLLGFAAGSLL